MQRRPAGEAFGEDSGASRFGRRRDQRCIPVRGAAGAGNGESRPYGAGRSGGCGQQVEPIRRERGGLLGLRERLARDRRIELLGYRLQGEPAVALSDTVDDLDGPAMAFAGRPIDSVDQNVRVQRKRSILTQDTPFVDCLAIELSPTERRALRRACSNTGQRRFPA